MGGVKQWLRDLFAPRVITVTRTHRPLTDAEMQVFDRAFAKMADAFDELGKIRP